ncbi:aldehyde dehydrogenase family protein [Azospirillum sp. Sh1]|uniref:aldehyde dehydrogenase family protein n=1 Tax=Azospirillum sp. Sh1 TaxID=2607285 RepID=UPI0011EDB08D|nr:aldehyde dehydrogenase family protein [Azospirillum sp. Sh1]KAA0570214.1 aldehyde dehydrogenase family protein [Azospirillum sp. Sh1]
MTQERRTETPAIRLLPEVDAFLKRKHGLIVGDGRPSAASSATMAVMDPATGTAVSNVAAGTADDVDVAVRAARSALEGPWSSLTPSERQRLLHRLADLIERNGEELAQLETINNGKSIHMSRALEVGGAVEFLRYMAGWATRLEGSTLNLSTRAPGAARYHAYTVREPVGVVGAIIPWNFPLGMAIWKIGPALACGCTVVLKPADETPLTALRLGELCLEAGIPPGVVNVVTGTGPEAGAALAAHPGIDKIAFTGSTEVGKRVGLAAVSRMARFSLELGGKSPMIMFPDMDSELTGLAANLGVFFNQGQVCACGSRIYAHASIFDRVVADIAGMARSLKMGSGLDPDSQINPLVSAKQQNRVLGFVERALEDGAEALSGAAAGDGPGYFVKPTLLVNAGDTMEIVREEVFGPVVVAMPFKDMDDVIARANDTRYGLAASVWTRDIATAHAAVARLKAGTVWVNTHNVLDASMPFGGFKESGIGREHGAEVLNNYLETKSVCVALPA